MTHHSFATSAALMDLLIKRYDITPPYGLNQRMFELYLDKKIVQVRLKVCHVLLYWIQNHFEEDFADNEFLILRFRDFIGKKVMADFEQMALQILDVLEKQLVDHDKVKTVISIPGERPKPLISSLRFGYDPLSNLLTDSKAFLDLDPLEMARQLTLLEHELYSKFQAYECLDQIWESHYRKEVAGYKQANLGHAKRHPPGSPNSDISKMIHHTNQV
jgi:son of sevenless-like protein